MHSFRKSLVGHFVTPQVTNMTVPRGGVRVPMDRLNTTIMPIWMASMPKAAATGASSGMRISMAAMPSMNMPTIRRKMFTASRNTYLLWITDTKNAVMAWGTCSMVRM